MSACLSSADLMIAGTQGIEDSHEFIAHLSEALSNVNPNRLHQPSILYTHQHSWNSNDATVSLLALMGALNTRSGRTRKLLYTRFRSVG